MSAAILEKEIDTPIVVAIATTGRPTILSDTLRYLSGLDDAPKRVIVSIAAESDVERDVLTDLPYQVDVLIGPKGLPNQRNTVMAVTKPDDIVLFLDDDFLICDGYLSAAATLFNTHPNVMVATGIVRADGILGPGFTHKDATDWLAAAPHEPEKLSPVNNGYGCNMAIRMAPVHVHGMEFDTTLPLYAWLEDVDFSRQMAAHGNVVKSNLLQGVHLGTKTGRSRGVPLGYSQIANPIYLCRKGTMHWTHALKMMSRNFAANFIKSFNPEDWVDRPGRLRGNLKAIGDMLTGRQNPTRVRNL